jgi:flagellar basal-body rod protein FlgC
MGPEQAGQRMSISAITGNALSGMQAHSRSFAATANNIANVSTAGYARLETSFSSNGAGGVSASVSPSSDGAAVDLANEMLDRINAEIGFKANAVVFETGADMWDMLLTIKRD